MSLKLGAYELFGRIIPGAFYLAVFAQAGALAGLYKLDINAISQLSLAAILVLGFIAYILGTAFNLLSTLWIRLFRPKDPIETALDKFRKRNPDWNIHFKASDWYVLRAYIRRQNLALAEDVIERPNAFSLMLRNISLAMIFLAVVQIAAFITTGQVVYIALTISFILFSLLLGREARYFSVLFYSTIFETIMSFKIDLEDMLEKPKKDRSNPTGFHPPQS